MWRLGKLLSKLTKPTLEEIIELYNFSDEEAVICNMLSKRKGITEISMELGVSEITVSRRIANIKNKIGRSVVVITQNGQEIKDIKEIELPENIKKEIITLIS